MKRPTTAERARWEEKEVVCSPRVGWWVIEETEQQLLNDFNACLHFHGVF